MPNTTYNVPEKLGILIATEPGLDPVLSTSEELQRYQATEIVKWAKVR